MGKAKKIVKMTLAVTNLSAFLLDYYEGMTSLNIPIWLLEINRGIVSPEWFENAEEFDVPDKGVEVLDCALTSVWLNVVSNNDYGELAVESNTYEAMRRMYIENVEQRMDTVWDLLNTPVTNVFVKPFPILLIEDVDINIVRMKKTQTQEAMTKIMVKGKRAVKKEDVN
ncbi:MAG: hypothetical protein WC602_00335 [archaeon]